MMEGVRQYLVQVTAVAVFCGVITALIGKKGSIAVTVRLMAGIFLMLTMISPVTKVRLTGLSDLTDGIRGDAEALVADGEKSSRESMAAIIKERCEAYILDKAESLGAEISVEVSLSDDSLPVPCAVRISGSVSPYGKNRLTEIIQEELGIPVEEQTWSG